MLFTVVCTGNSPPVHGFFAEALSASIHDAEARGDWLAAFEVLTEARVTGVALPSDAIEGAVRTLAQGACLGLCVCVCSLPAFPDVLDNDTPPHRHYMHTAGQWQRAADLFDTTLQPGATLPSPRTLTQVMASLTTGKQPERAQALLKVCHYMLTVVRSRGRQ